MTAPLLHLVVPGPLDQRTGGYLYDARIVSELRALGRPIRVHSVEGRFPDVDSRALEDLDATLGAVEDGATVVVDGLAMGAAPAVVERHAGRLRLVSLVHHPLADETGLSADERERYERTEREALRHARGVLVTSTFTAARLGDFDVEPGRVRAVLPGTEPAPPAEPEAGAPARLVCVGTLTPRKGHDVLIRALASIDDLEWECLCAGSLTRDVAFVERVRTAAERFGISSRVRFLGELDAQALDEVYRTATLFVLPSYYEGYGMAFAEALARGIPIVGTKGGAIPHTVPPDAGVLVEPGDDRALAVVLRDLIEDAARRERLARAAHAHAARLPKWCEQARAFAVAVDELAGLGQ